MQRTYIKTWEFITLLLAFSALLLSNGTALRDETVEVGWIQHYGSEQVFSYDRANAVVVDDNGNIYITGEVGNAGLVTVKYQPDGSEAWSVACDGYIYTEYMGENIAVDVEGNVYVAYEDRMNNGFAVVKYLADGSEAWTGHPEEPINNGQDLRAFVLDAQGQAYLGGNINGNDGYNVFLVVKFDASGQHAWSATYDDVGSGVLTALTVDVHGNIYVTGRWHETDVEYDYCTIKYDSTGSETWIAHYNGEGNGSDRAYAVAVDDFGCVYVTGGSENTSGDQELTTIKYDSSGTVIWVNRHGVGLGEHAVGRRLGLDDDGHVYVSGRCDVNGLSDVDFITIKYDNDGSTLWERRYGSPAQEPDWVKDLVVSLLILSDFSVKKLRCTFVI